jgi:hypothetical protein
MLTARASAAKSRIAAGPSSTAAPALQDKRAAEAAQPTSAEPAPARRPALGRPVAPATGAAARARRERAARAWSASAANASATRRHARGAAPRGNASWGPLRRRVGPGEPDAPSAARRRRVLWEVVQRRLRTRAPAKSPREHALIRSVRREARWSRAAIPPAARRCYALNLPRRAARRVSPRPASFKWKSSC